MKKAIFNVHPNADYFALKNRFNKAIGILLKERVLARPKGRNVSGEKIERRVKELGTHENLCRSPFQCLVVSFGHIR